MLGAVAKHVRAGDLRRAREALAAAVKDLFYEHYCGGPIS